MKKFFVKLMGGNEQRADFPHMINKGNKDVDAIKRELVREREEMATENHNKKFVTDRTIPTEQAITDPSESESV